MDAYMKGNLVVMKSITVCDSDVKCSSIFQPSFSTAHSVKINCSSLDSTSNQEFLVHDMESIPEVNDSNIVWQGYHVCLPVDIRHSFDIKTQWCECHVVSKNQLLVKAPSMPYSLRHKQDFGKIRSWATANNKEHIFNSMLMSLTISSNRRPRTLT